MNNEKDGEVKKAEDIPDAMFNKVTMKLSIWDVPMDTGKRFIKEAEKKYGRKQWLYLKSLMDNETTFELLNTRIKLIEERLENITNGLTLIIDSLTETEKEIEKPKGTKQSNDTKKIPKTFGKKKEADSNE